MPANDKGCWQGKLIGGQLTNSFRFVQ